MKRYRGRRAQKSSLGISGQTLSNVGALLLVLVGLLTALSFFVQSEILSVLSESYKALFGWTAIFFALLTSFLGFYWAGFRLRFIKINFLLGASVLLLSLAALSVPFKNESGGVLAQTAWASVSAILTPFGGGIIFLITLAVGFVILTNTPLDQAFYSLGQFLRRISSIFSAVASRITGRGGGFEQAVPFKVRGGSAAVAQPDKLRTDAEGSGLGTQVVANSPTEGRIWQYPPLSLLSSTQSARANRGNLKQNASIIEKTLESFGIAAKVAEVNCGPTVTQYALEISLGTKLSKITALQNDLALALATPTGTVRIEAPIPGKSLVGIEIPNVSPEIVNLKDILSADVMRSNKSKIAVGLGLDVAGSAVVADVGKMPHVLIAGATNSGKSVLINAMIASLLFRSSPNEVKLILIDPKRVEMADYNGIPHLLTPVVVEVEKILSSLKWAMAEMERRYKLFASAGVRNITGYNELSGFQALPYIVIIIDELADLMSYAPVEVEDAICRLAQMARATGIHLILATQRPSVDVLTGLIKANIPCRIAFNVSSMVDSRVIIDQPGAEKLLGRGDMLYVPPDASKPVRIQGVFVSDTELRGLIDFIKKSGVEPEYTEEVTSMPLTWMRGRGASSSGGDALFEEAVRTVCQYNRASASLLQRRLRVGYARAARLLDELETAGVVGPGEGAKPRDVLVKNPEEFLAAKSGNGDGSSLE